MMVAHAAFPERFHAVGDLFLGPGGECAGEQQRGAGRDGGYSLHYYLPSGRFFGDASHRRSIPNTRYDSGRRREIPGLASISASRDQGDVFKDRLDDVGIIVDTELIR